MGADVTDGGSGENDEGRSDRADRTGSGTHPITDAVLPCGGRGTRLGGDVEKPLVEVDGVATVDRVLDALANSRVERVVAVSSPHTPATTRHLRDRTSNADGPGGPGGIDLDVRIGDGDGYVEDLDHGLAVVGRPTVTVVADLPLVRGVDVDDAIDAAVLQNGPVSGNGTVPGDDAVASDDAVSSITVCVPADTKRELGVSVDTTFDHEGLTLAPTGLNVVADARDRIVVRRRRSLAVNVNRPSDLRVARRLARRHDGSPP